MKQEQRRWGGGKGRRGNKWSKGGESGGEEEGEEGGEVEQRRKSGGKEKPGEI